jgi:cbb3-type cytochrome oxidase maturation protein
MDVLIVLVFVSLVLVGGGVLLLLFSLHQHDFEHAERLSLLPLQDSDTDPPRT